MPGDDFFPRHLKKRLKGELCSNGSFENHLLKKIRLKKILLKKILLKMILLKMIHSQKKSQKE